MNFVAGVDQIAAQLRDAGDGVTDTQKIAKILSSLPPSYKHFGSAWDSTPRDQQTLSALTKRLVKEEKAIKILNGGKMDPTDAAFFGKSGQPTQPPDTPTDSTQSGTVHAFAAGGHRGSRGNGNRGGHRGGGVSRGASSGFRGRGGFGNSGGFHPYSSGKRGGFNQFSGKNKEGNQSSSIECYYCGEKGHIQRKCRHFKRDQANENNGEQQTYSYKSTTDSSDKR